MSWEGGDGAGGNQKQTWMTTMIGDDSDDICAVKVSACWGGGAKCMRPSPISQQQLLLWLLFSSALAAPLPWCPRGLYGVALSSPSFVNIHVGAPRARVAGVVAGGAVVIVETLGRWRHVHRFGFASKTL